MGHTAVTGNAVFLGFVKIVDVVTLLALDPLLPVNALGEGRDHLLVAASASRLGELVGVRQGRYAGVAVDARHASMRIFLVGVVALETFLGLEGSSGSGAQEKHECRRNEKDPPLSGPHVSHGRSQDLRQSRRLAVCWPLKGACSQTRKEKATNFS